MSETQNRVLDHFKLKSTQEICINDIIKSIYAHEFNSIIKTINAPYSTKEEKSNARHYKAKLQRKLSHHISQLLLKNKIEISSTKRGIKYYKLIKSKSETNITNNAIRSYYSFPALPLADLEKEKSVQRFEQKHFFDRVNSILVEADKICSFETLTEYILSLFSIVNDVVAVNRFESLLTPYTIEAVVESIKRLDVDCSAYDKTICLIIDIENCKLKNNILEFFELLFKSNIRNIRFVMEISSRDLIEKEELLEEISNIFSINNAFLNIKNKDLHEPPYLIGKTGPYTFENNDWNAIKKHVSKKTKTIICSQSSIAIDVKKIFSKTKSAKSLKKDILRCAKAINIANFFQRNDSLKYYEALKNTDEPKSFEVLKYATNNLRLLNFNVYDTIDENLAFLNTLKEIKIDVKNLAISQEAIYRSCGMPLRLSIAFSVAYNIEKCFEGFYSNARAIVIKKTTDILANSIKEKIKYYEKIRKIFDGGFELRLNREGTVNKKEIINEIGILMNSYKIPLFCYNFLANSKNKDQTLNSFVK